MVPRIGSIGSMVIQPSGFSPVNVSLQSGRAHLCLSMFISFTRLTANLGGGFFRRPISFGFSLALPIATMFAHHSGRRASLSVSLIRCEGGAVSDERAK